MPQETICKTVRQYSRDPIRPEDMGKLQEIAVDYAKVKNYVYQRYGGVRSLSKLYPGYTVQNEMTACGLRGKLGLPSVYFYLAVFDALGDIKAQWAKVKNAIYDAITRNEQFLPEERHYLRFVMRVSSCFDNILAGREAEVPQEMREAYREVMAGVEAEKLNRYLCRQVRKKLKKLHTDKADGFSATERAYRYADHGIYVSTKEKRKRVFIPLTDGNIYRSQIYIKLKPEKGMVEITVPIQVGVRHHGDYRNEVGLAVGIWRMFTTDSGVVYGERFGEIHTELANFLRDSDSTYRREKKNNPGREKYKNKKEKLNRKLENYVNKEINHMLDTEKPAVIYLPKLPRSSGAGNNKQINYSMGVWKRGYIRKRLEQKCRENDVQIVEVLGKGIGTECSGCGQRGISEHGIFRCASCGYEADGKVNAARNAKKRGLSGGQLNQRHAAGQIRGNRII